MMTHVDVGVESINGCADSISVFWHDVMSRVMLSSKVEFCHRLYLFVFIENI